MANNNSNFLKLSRIKFKAGQNIESTPLETQIGSVLILVGPNNSGKSLSLHEIENFCSRSNVTSKVIENVNINLPTPEGAITMLERFRTSPPQGSVEAVGHMWIGKLIFKPQQEMKIFQINIEAIKNEIKSNNVSDYLRQNFVATHTIRLDGRTRFGLADNQPAGDIKNVPQNHLWALFKNEQARKKVRDIVKSAFDLYFVIDPTPMTQFAIRLSEVPPKDSSEEQGLDERSRKFHSNASHISEFSDGVQAFVGLVSALLSLDDKIMLIDEPEAFLHPSLAHQLGANMAEIAKDRNASLIVATHSSEFLISCLEKIDDVSVIRLTYKDKVPTARELNAGELKSIMRDPLLRSTKTLEGLFYSAVIITESDTDRAFYDEINRRLQTEKRGINQAFFTNGQNKQTLHRIVQPLRRIGVPAVAIPDLDILEDEGTIWKNFLSAAGIPDSEIKSLENDRKKIAAEFNSLPLINGERPIKKVGIDALSTNKLLAKKLLDQLSKYGIFVVPKGEVECWLTSLGAKGHGANWLVDIFSKFGSHEGDANFVKPGKDDVWEFIEKIAEWTNKVQSGVIPPKEV